MCFWEPLLDCWPAKKKYLQINAFSNLMVVEQEENPHTPQSYIEELQRGGKRDE